jgi:hypothetical protein
VRVEPDAATDTAQAEQHEHDQCGYAVEVDGVQAGPERRSEGGAVEQRSDEDDDDTPRRCSALTGDHLADKDGGDGGDQGAQPHLGTSAPARTPSVWDVAWSTGAPT